MQKVLNDIFNVEKRHFCRQLTATFITTGVTDDSWNQYVKLFDDMKIDEYITMYQNALDSMEIE